MSKDYEDKIKQIANDLCAGFSTQGYSTNASRLVELIRLVIQDELTDLPKRVGRTMV